MTRSEAARLGNAKAQETRLADYEAGMAYARMWKAQKAERMARYYARFYGEGPRPAVGGFPYYRRQG